MYSPVLPLACLLTTFSPPGIEFENSFLQVLPISKNVCHYVHRNKDVHFHLYTRYNPTVYEELFLYNDETLAASQIDFNIHTVIYFHAFLENAEGGSALRVREAYMLRGDTNVIVIDAQRLEAGPWYKTAAENTWAIGNFAGEFIDYLVSRGLDLSKTHLVGHSLGAQAAGVAGQSLRTGKVARITGLDPALPLFDKLPLSQKLDASDAHFVDVIHTDAGIFGVHNPIGHADFYPNGGISPQPGCELEVVWPKDVILEKCENKATKEIPLDELIINIDLEEKPSVGVTRKAALKRNIKNNKYITKYLNAKPKRRENKYSKINTYIPKNYDFEEDLESSFQNPEPAIIRNIKSPVKKRQKRFISFFRRQPDENENDKFLFRMLDFLIKNRKTVIPVVSVIREMNTLVKSANGELNHVSKERNNYIGTPAPNSAPITFDLELGRDPPGKAILKRMLGLNTHTEKLKIGGGGTSSGGGLFG